MLARLGILYAFILVSIQASYQQLENNSQYSFYKGLTIASQGASFPEDYSDLSANDYNQILVKIPFYGPWINANGASQVFNYFDKTEGYMTTVPSDSDDSDFGTMDLSLMIYNGRYIDQRYVKIAIDTPVDGLVFDPANASLAGQEILVNISAGYDNNQRELRSCMSNFTIYFLDLQVGGPFVTSGGKTLDDVGIQVTIESPECSITVVTQILKNNDLDQQELMIYIGFQVAAAIIGIFSTKVLLRGFPDDLSKLNRISLWSIWAVNAWDFYTFLFHIALSVALSGWLMIVGVAFFVLSIMYQTKLVYGIYISSNNARAYATFASGCKFFALYYGLLYLLVFSYTFFTRSIWAILSSSLYIGPQIILVFFRGRKYKFNLWHLVGLGITRMAFVGYTKIYPSNIFKLSPNLEFVIIYFGIILGQVSVLSIQKILPKFCWTQRPFKYFVKVTDLQEKEEMCPICMEVFQEQPISSKTPLMEDTKSIIVMQTPCKHRYHKDCLVAWMKTKLECPSCRQPVPSLNNEEV